jgi:hypothetical protein
MATAGGATVDGARGDDDRVTYPRWLLIAAAVATVAAAVVAFVVIPRVRHFYNTVPLVASSVDYPDSTPLPRTWGGSTPPEASVAYRYGQPYRYTFTLTNTSRWKVQVRDIPNERGFALLEQESVLLGNQPLRPVTLKPHESRVVTVISRFANCSAYDVHSSEGTTGVHVAYRLLGVNRTAAIDLPEWVSVASPQECPELNAQDGDAAGPNPIDANLRFTLPDYRLWISNWDKRPLVNCTVSLSTVAQARLTRLDGDASAFIDSSEFVGQDGTRWQPAENPPTSFEMRCAGTGPMTGAFGRGR